MLIIPLNLDSVLLLLHNSKLAYYHRRNSNTCLRAMRGGGNHTLSIDRCAQASVYARYSLFSETLIPDQTIATFQRNLYRNIVGHNMLHAFGRPAAVCCTGVLHRRVAPACCTGVLRRVFGSNLSSNISGCSIML